MMFAPRYTVWHCGYLKGGRKMNLCNCLQCNTNNCPAAKEFNDLQKQSNAQLNELHRISEALGTNEGHSSVTHIELLKAENAKLRELLRLCKPAVRNVYPSTDPLLEAIDAAMKEEGK